jgi:hypothetical protein
MDKLTDKNVNAIADDLIKRKGNAFKIGIETQKAIDPERADKVIRRLAVLLMIEAVKDMAEARV